MPERFFQLNDDVGVEPEWLTGEDSDGKPDPAADPVPNPKKGELQPLQPIALTGQIPVERDGVFTTKSKQYLIKPRDSVARIIATDDPLVCVLIEQLVSFHEIDPPKKTTTGKESDNG